MKSYPYIGRLKDKENGVVLFCDKDEGAQLNSSGKGWHDEDVYKYTDDWDERKFKNITAEYLANTYGEVKSKEHAEFIVKLAEVNNVTVSGCANTENAKWFSFRIDKGIVKLTLLSLYKSLILDDGRKQITIPLPPKEFLMEFEEREGEVSKDDEWPKVGGEVEAKHDSGQVLKGELLAITNEYAIIQQVGREQHLHRSAWVLSKPKTPEQELREFLHLLWRENNEDFDDFADIAVLHLTKKGEGDE